MEVQQLGGGQVMILGGDPNNWVCTWVHNGTTMTQTFQPEQLERVLTGGSSLTGVRIAWLGPSVAHVTRSESHRRTAPLKPAFSST